MDVLSAGITQHVAEEVHLAAAFLSEVHGVDGPIHLCLHPRPRLKTFHGRPMALGAQLLDPLTKNGVAARIAAATNFFQQPDHADVGISLQVIPQGGLVGIDEALPALPRLGQASCAVGPLLPMLGKHLGHGLPRQVQIAGDVTS